MVFILKTFLLPSRVNVIVKRSVLYYISKYPLAKIPLLTWYNEFSKQDFASFNQLKKNYGNASVVANQRVIFNIKGNDFRLVTSVNFKQQAAYIIWFGTHAEYDRINVETVEFNPKILEYKAR